MQQKENEVSILKGKTAVVTGSTSGIGLGCARAFAGAGANIVLNGIRAPASAPAATLHGVVFDILVESANRVGQPAFAERLRRGSLHSLRERRLVGPAGLEPATRPL
jgi:hypothetical protein